MHFSNDKSKYEEFHEQVASTEDMKTIYTVVGVNADAEKYLLNLHVDERIILKRILKNWNGCGLDSSVAGQRTVAGGLLLKRY